MTEDIPKIKATITFRSISDISGFKKECSCNDFYIDRDALTLVGEFTESELRLATENYSALYSV